MLEALARQRVVQGFDILIGNNDVRDLFTYPELSAPGLPPFRVISVTTRGVSAVRNAMISEVLGRPAVPRWIACLDDDQIPADDWLSQLVRAGNASDADLVGGPVVRQPDTTTFWSGLASDTSYLPSRAGPTAMLNEAGNLLMSTAFLRALGGPPFSVDYGRTGGEDYEFFLRAKCRNAHLVWAPEARVSEPLPADRLTFRSYVWRFFAIAAYQARADRVSPGDRLRVAVHRRDDREGTAGPRAVAGPRSQPAARRRHRRAVRRDDRGSHRGAGGNTGRALWRRVIMITGTASQVGPASPREAR